MTDVPPEAARPAARPCFQVRDLRIHFPTDDGLVKAVDGVSFSLDRGRTLGIVGESGSGNRPDRGRLLANRCCAASPTARR